VDCEGEHLRCSECSVFHTRIVTSCTCLSRVVVGWDVLLCSDAWNNI
jgi:hypothetical protein